MKRFAVRLILAIFVLLLISATAGCRSAAVQHYENGIALLEQNQYEQAISEFSKATELDNKYAEAFNSRGTIYAYRGEYDKAIADLNNAIELNPTISEVFVNRGVIYAYRGEYDRAIADFNKAIELNPYCISALNNLRIINQAKEKEARTIADLELCIELPQYPPEQMGIRTCCLTIKRPPVLLVHGLMLTSFDLDSTWGEMANYLTGKDVLKDGDWEWVSYENNVIDPDYSMKRLEGNSFVIYISNYTHQTSVGTGLDIRIYALSLASEVELIKERERVQKVDIVAHSMGGLVARVYIENEDLRNNPYKKEYKGDIRKLIMIATPNHGTYYSRFYPDLPYWESVHQMKEVSSLLMDLNGGVTGTQKGVEYSAIAGNAFRCGASIVNPLAELICLLSNQKDNDGVVSVDSVKLEKQDGADEISESRWFVLNLKHLELRRMPAGPVVEHILLSPTLINK